MGHREDIATLSNSLRLTDVNCFRERAQSCMFHGVLNTACFPENNYDEWFDRE